MTGIYNPKEKYFEVLILKYKAVLRRPPPKKKKSWQLKIQQIIKQMDNTVKENIIKCVEQTVAGQMTYSAVDLIRTCYQEM